MATPSNHDTEVRLLARQLLNRFRQASVIDISIFNAELLAAEQDVIEAISVLPGSRQLLLHLDNLKNGHTPKDQIDPTAMPFASVTGAAAKPILPSSTDDSDKDPLPKKIAQAFASFDSSYDSLERFVKDFGDDWMNQFSEASHSYAMTDEEHAQFNAILSYKKLIDLWFKAQSMIQNPDKEIIQDLIDNYQNDLIQFGDEGVKLVETLKTLAQE